MVKASKKGRGGVQVHTAARILKGALCKVLGIPCGGCTSGLMYRNEAAGQLKLGTVQPTAPSAEELEEVVKVANSFGDLPVHTYRVSREVADEKLGTAYLGAARLPPSLTELTIVYIPGVHVGLLDIEDSGVVSKTSSVGTIKIESTKFISKKRALTVDFSVELAPAFEAAVALEEPVYPSKEELETLNPAWPKRVKAVRCSKCARIECSPEKCPLPAEEAAAMKAAFEKASGTGAHSGSGGGGGGGGGGGKKKTKVDPPKAPAPKAKDASKGEDAAVGDAPAGGGGGSADAPAEGAPAEGGQVVTPWDVAAEGGIDYAKLIRDFGCSAIDETLIKRIEKHTGRRAHPFLRRGLFFSHRDLNLLMDKVEKGEKFFLYTGRGPSSDCLHLGHLVPFMFTQYLQEAFDVPLVIQMTDDEKYLWKNLTYDQVQKMLVENVRDIIACGFKKEKTFIFSNLEYYGVMYPTILRIQKCVTLNTARSTFGFDGSSNIGKVAFPAVQAAPSFSEAFPKVLRGAKNMLCLIPQAIDQDPYFRLTRDVAPRLGFVKPALIHSEFFPSLQGFGTKMGSSAAETAIFVNDTPEAIKKKVKGSFSGGRPRKEEQEEMGADLTRDVPYAYLKFLLDDDEKLEDIRIRYGRPSTELKGGKRMFTKEVKEILTEVLLPIVEKHQKARAEATDEVVRAFMTERELDF